MSQEVPAEGVFAEEIQVTEVLLDVVVTDRHDQVILGLGRDDFVVIDEGEEVELTSVTFYGSPRLLEWGEGLARRGVAVESRPRDRHFILFFQRQPFQSTSTRPSLLDRQLKAGRQITRWLEEEVQPGDRVAVVSYRRGLEVHQDFTSGRQALIDAVDAAVHGRRPATGAPERGRPAEGSPAGLSSLPAGKELRRVSKDLYRALRLVADAVREVPGRKNLVFVGRGFGELSSFGGYQPDHPRLDPTMYALNDANVAVYTLDLTPAGTEYSLQISLRDLAADTGGRFYYDRVNFTASLKEISAHASGYYLLSYQSRRPATASGYQRVTVGSRNRELRIQARQGYLYGKRPRP